MRDPKPVSIAEKLREALDRARDNAPETGIDVTAVVEIPAKPKPPPPVVPPPHTEPEREREP